jgi:hypothetical protein
LLPGRVPQPLEPYLGAGPVKGSDLGSEQVKGMGSDLETVKGTGLDLGTGAVKGEAGDSNVAASVSNNVEIDTGPFGLPAQMQG